MNYKWGRRKVSAQYLIDQIPNDGCLLVFNAPHRNFRTKTHGLLEVHSIDEPREATREGGRVRDLYICWKGYAHD